MKKQKKSIGNVIVMAMFCWMAAVVMFGELGCVRAASPDYSDKTWTYNLSVDSTNYQYTKGYAKGTNSAIYLKTEKYYNTLTKIAVTPYARASEWGNLIAAGYYNASTGVREFRSYTVPGLGQYMVTNYVYEISPNYYVSLGFKGLQGSGTVTGKMSPDCSGSYTRLY